MPALVGDGWRGYAGRSVERNRTGAKWCPARVQTVSRAVESTGLPGVRGRGLFQHLRGSIFCGALAKCALADFGCDLFQGLRGWVRGELVIYRARIVRTPPCAGIGTDVSPRGKEIGRNSAKGGIIV